VTERHDGLTDERQDDDDGEDLLGEDEAEPIEETHPGFTITCQECGSRLVVVESDLEFSPAAGRRGNVYLRCTDCDAETFLLPRGEEDEEDER
jgi:ribosomal protein S27E